MKMVPRPYVMAARAKAAAGTRARIVASAAALLCERTFDDMTLEAIAADAGTTVRTMLRIFGGKEMVFAAALESFGPGGFGPVRPGDVEATLDALYGFYEKFGDMVIRWLADERRVAPLRDHLQTGRRHLREWVGESFEPTLAGLKGDAREETHNALIAALDVYTWKLARRDFGLSREAARAVARRIVSALIGEG